MIKGEATLEISTETVIEAIETHLNASLTEGAKLKVVGLQASTSTGGGGYSQRSPAAPLERLTVKVEPQT